MKSVSEVMLKSWKRGGEEKSWKKKARGGEERGGGKELQYYNFMV